MLIAMEQYNIHAGLGVLICRASSRLPKIDEEAGKVAVCYVGLIIPEHGSP
jgi:hypothetical protein